MSFKEKIRGFRERLTDRHIYTIVLGITAAIAIFGIYQYKKANEYQVQVQNAYQRSFHDLVDFVGDIDVSLTKAMLVQTPSQLSLLANELWREASFAQASLGQLPIAHAQLDNTARFLSQVGDYTYSLSKNVAEGQKMTEENQSTLQQLADYSSKLNASLQTMESDIYNTMVKPGALQANSNKFFEGDTGEFTTALGEVEKEFVDYPALIYDGPFSDHIKNRKWVMLEGQPVLSAEEAQKKAEEFLGADRYNSIELTGEGGGKEETFTFRAMTNDKNREISLEVTKNGGFPLLLLDNRSAEVSNMDIPAAAAKAQAFLQEKGYYNMKESYYQRTGNDLLVNFAYEQGGFIMYPDLVKVKVAMDDGEIIGFESMGYLTNHKDRILPNIKVTKAEALEIANRNLKVDKVNYALIPTDSQRDVYCYEIKGNFLGRNYLIYVNVETGKEEKILLLEEDENGTLTI